MLGVSLDEVSGSDVPNGDATGFKLVSHFTERRERNKKGVSLMRSDERKIGGHHHTWS